MKISDLIEELQKIQEKEGDIEVTCTHSLMGDPPKDKSEAWAHLNGYPYETTVETLIVSTDEVFGTHVRLWL